MKQRHQLTIMVIIMVLTALTTSYTQADVMEDLTFIGVINDYPFIFTDKNGEPAGFAYDMIKEFADQKGYNLIVELHTPEQASKAYEEYGDVLYDGTYFSMHRGGKTLPLFVQEYYVFLTYQNRNLVKKDDLHSFYETAQGLANLTIGVRDGQEADDYVNSLVVPGKLKTFTHYSQVIEALHNEEIDVAIMPYHQTNAILYDDDISDVEFVDQKLYFKNSGYWVKKDRVQNQLDSFIIESKTNGRVTRLSAKWLEEPDRLNRDMIYLQAFNIILGLSIAIILFLIYRGKTLQKRVEDKTSQLREKLTENQALYDEIIQHEKFKNDYFINLSHELRTPLNVILGAVQLNELYLNKQNYDKLLENVGSYTHIIKSNSYRLLRVVNNLIDITKMDADKYMLNIDVVDIIYLCEELIITIQPYLDLKDLTVSLQTDLEESLVECDPFELDRIMMNLLSNAIKFSDPGSEIIIQIDEPTEDFVQVDVIDQGIGIAEEFQEKIFNRFEQVDTTLNRSHEGHGIGLSLVKNLVELHGGQINVSSVPGEGSTFSLQLPLRTTYIGFEGDRAFSHQQRDKQHAVNLEFSELQQDTSIRNKE